MGYLAPSMGPLTGLKVVEVAGIGPGPFAAMMLSDMGAEVIRVDRAARARPGEVPVDVLSRGRRSVGVDLKHPRGVETVLMLVEQADALIEGYRPGVMERLGLGPDVCLSRNPRLVYGRMTGWGQHGPLAPTAGHDIDYIAISGVLGSIGRHGEIPTPPINLVGDFGGGGMLLAFGVMCGVFEAQRSGQGQVIDAAMVDGASLLMSMFWGLRSVGAWGERGTNLLDTGAHFYQVYETADGEHMAVGAIEPQFYAELLKGVGLEAADLPGQNDKSQWPAMKERLAAIFKSKSRAEWESIFEGTDACVSPVRSFAEVGDDPHMVARDAFVEVAGVKQPAPAPRFSRTPGAVQRPPQAPGANTDDALAAWGFSTGDIADLRGAGAIA